MSSAKISSNSNNNHANTDRNYVIEVCICTTLNFPVNDIILKNATKNIPKKTFGVFVGVYRSSLQELKSWPKDVHGCIGYYDQNFKTLSKSNIIQHMIKVSKDATYKDSRNKYFSPIYTDLYASYEVYFMVLPIMEVDYETGTIISINEPFDNNIYGLIYKDLQSYTATYLPGVFDDDVNNNGNNNSKHRDYNWQFIANSLINKSGNKPSSNNIGKFYAYRCVRFKDTLISLLLNHDYVKYLCKVFVNDFLQENYKDFVPYKVQNNQIITNKDVPKINLDIINTILYLELFIYNKLIFDSKLIVLIIENINYYLNRYVNNSGNNSNNEDNNSSASSELRGDVLLEIAPNLMAILDKLRQLTNDAKQKQIIDTTIRKICKNVSNILFTTPQQDIIVLANLITMTQLCKFNNKFDLYQRELYKNELNQSRKVTDIFRINFTVKFLYFMRKYFNQLYEQNIQLLLEKYLYIVQIINENIATIDTHFISAAFECSCILVLFLIDINNNQQQNIQLRNNVFELFYHLQQRKLELKGKYVAVYKQLNNEGLISVSCDMFRGLLALNGYLCCTNFDIISNETSIHIKRK